MPTLDYAAGNAAVSTEVVQTQVVDAGAGATGGQPDYKTLYEQAASEARTYQARFTGLQGTYQREQEKWKSDAAQLSALNEQVKAVTGEKETLATAKSTLAEEHDRAVAELGILRAQNQRVATVMEKFPQLLQFMDVLPDGVGEEWEKKLEKFQARLTGLGAEGVKKILETATPAPPAANTTLTADDKLVQARKAALSGDMKEYDRLYSEYLKEKSQAK